MIHKDDSFLPEKDRRHATIISNALSRAGENRIKLPETRPETPACLALSIMRQGSICLGRISRDVQTGSVRRQFDRPFHPVKRDGAAACGAATVVSKPAEVIAITST
ncbi:MAG: hypothetical protein ACREC9_16925 [Methylocella sp.]